MIIIIIILLLLLLLLLSSLLLLWYYNYYHKYYYNLAVVSHLFKMKQLKVNFGLLRNPSFLAARVGALTYWFEFWINLMKIKNSLKKQNFDTTSHARTQKRGVPEEAKIGRTITRFGFWINLMKIKKSLKTKTLILFRMRAPKKEGSLRRQKLAVPSLGLDFE